MDYLDEAVAQVVENLLEVRETVLLERTAENL